MDEMQRCVEVAKETIQICRRELDLLESGKMHSGSRTQGAGWIDTTPESIAKAQKIIADQERLIRVIMEFQGGMIR